MVFYIIIFFILATLFTSILILITCINCLGLTGIAKKLISALGSSKYDRKYSESCREQPINS